ncbi:hypothetical protein DVH24_034266 [Malus domestica]|uniref:Secreted protein n=1 Tax=Malus domestica TaxID=3750 RepID=A0A498IVU6_MALDO|nr:hypothetical protein DVH24_034266 [Malus domestica]
MLMWRWALCYLLDLATAAEEETCLGLWVLEPEDKVAIRQTSNGLYGHKYSKEINVLIVNVVRSSESQTLKCTCEYPIIKKNSAFNVPSPRSEMPIISAKYCRYYWFLRESIFFSISKWFSG